MEAKSYAKINWTLRITGKRSDGYHDLETVFQTISLHDTMTFSRASGLRLTCDDPTVPTDDSNLIVRAARALGVANVRIDLRKRIPAGGGLGGGSSNAATTLRVLDGMFSLKTPAERLLEIALSLGSDVPFFLYGGTAYATGRGEEITALPSKSGVPLILLLPDVRVSTAEAFSLIRSYSKPAGRDVLLDPARMTNDFEEPIFARHPELRDLKSQLIDAGAWWAAMTGSGSTIVGAFRTAADRDAALGRLRGARPLAADTL